MMVCIFCVCVVVIIWLPTRDTVVDDARSGGYSRVEGGLILSVGRKKELRVETE
jgi:hypothetical protein